MYDELAMIELERREDAEGPGPRLWDATPGVCCAAYQLGACEHTEAWASEDYAAMEAAWREADPEGAAAQDAADAEWAARAAAAEAAQDARWGVRGDDEEPF